MNQLVDIRNLIKELGKEKTVVLSTHIMQEVQALCDRVIIINNGVLVADDPIESLQDRIKGENKITLNLTNNKVDLAVLKKLPGINSVEKTEEGIIIRSDSDVDVRPKLFKTAVDAGWVIIEMKKEDINVEHVFQKLTKEDSYA